MEKPQSTTLISIYNFEEGIISYKKLKVYKHDLFKKLIRKYTPTPKDRLFIYPDCTIPRFKMKGFCEKHKVAVAKVKDTADKLFINPDTINNGCEYYSQDNWATLVKREFFINYIKTSTRVDDPRYAKLLEDLHEDTEMYIHIEQDLSKFEEEGVNKHVLNLVYEDDFGDDDADKQTANAKNRGTLYYQTEAQEANFDLLVSKDLYHQDALLSLLNTGTVLDEEMYKGITNLFDSDDNTNHKIAMEAMANCDFLKSGVYLLMIFYNYHQKIYSSDVKHHVNFKSLRTFFDIRSSFNLSIDEIIDKLKNKKILDAKNLAIVMAEAKKVVLAKVESEMDSFVIVDIEPSEEVKKEVEETEAEIAAAQIIAPVIEVTPVVEVKPDPIIEIEEPTIDTGGLSHL